MNEHVEDLFDYKSGEEAAEALKAGKMLSNEQELFKITRIPLLDGGTLDRVLCFESEDDKFPEIYSVDLWIQHVNQKIEDRKKYYSSTEASKRLLAGEHVTDEDGVLYFVTSLTDGPEEIRTKKYVVRVENDEDDDLVVNLDCDPKEFETRHWYYKFVK
jgi:hypothetical protein